MRVRECLRRHSVPVQPALPSAGQLGLPDAVRLAAGRYRGYPQAATVTVDGTQSTTFGAASITGTDASAFTITANTCSGQTLGYGATCAVEVTPKATALTDQIAFLTLADNGIGGSINRRLTLTGYDPRDATVSGSMDFGWVPAYDTSAPQTVTLTEIGQLPSRSAPGRHGWLGE